MSRRGSEGGRKKSLLDPRRHVKCPVSECKYSGRTDHVKRHFRNLIVWSKTYEGEAAEESENVFISAPRDSKQHTKWCRRNGFTKTKMPYFHSKEQPMSSVLNFFSQSSMNNNERPGSAETGAGAEMEDAEMENAEMEFAAGMENTAGMEDSAQIEDVHMEDAVQMEGEGRDRIQHFF